MAGCGYVCPVCEGSGKDDQGDNCTWCTPLPNTSGLKETEEKSKKEDATVSKLTTRNKGTEVD